MRLSGLLHLVATNGNELIITSQVVDDAIALGYGLLEHAKVAFTLMRLDAVVRNAIHINEWIKAQSLQSFTRTNLSLAMRHNMKKEAIDAAVAELIERHILQAVELQGKSNKPVTHYYVNPACHNIL